MACIAWLWGLAGLRWRAWVAGLACHAWHASPSHRLRAQQGDILSGGVAGTLTHASILAIALPLFTMTMPFAPLGRAGARTNSLAQVATLGGGEQWNCSFLFVAGGRAFEHIGTHWNTSAPPFPPPQFASRPGPPGARAVFRAGGECPSSGCVMSQQKDYNILGGVAGILTHAFTLAIALPLLTMTMSFALFGHTGTHRVTFRRVAARWGGAVDSLLSVSGGGWGRLREHIGTHWNTMPSPPIDSLLSLAH